MAINIKEKGECDIVVTVTHSETCSCLAVDTHCVICGGEDDICEYFTAQYYGLEADKFCYDCAILIHEHVVMPMETRLKP